MSRICSELHSRFKAAMAEPSMEPSKTIFVACFPKSGSTYVTKLLAAVTDSCVISMSTQVGGQNEQDLHQPSIAAALGKTSVAHQHAKGTYNNVALMKLYGIRPIILVRNIFDVVVSLADHIQNESPLTPTGYVPVAYSAMTRDERLASIVHLHVPWYINFYCSWVEHVADVDGMWLTYEEFFADPLAAARHLTQFYGLEVSDERLCAAIAGMKDTFTRLNVGRSGRGAALPARCRQQILDMARASALAPCDLDRIGIEATVVRRSKFDFFGRRPLRTAARAG
jgi:Sulfotransferase domain